MKKMITFLLMLMVVALPIALADDTTVNETQTATTTEQPLVVDPVTEQEIGIMNSTYGAKVRLLQLEKSITQNIMLGSEVLNTVNQTNGNTTDLESILTEMSLLKIEVQDADPAADNATTTYIDLKSDATNLVTEFRNTARSILPASQIAQLRTKLNGEQNQEINDLNTQIQEIIKEYNAEKLRTIFNELGINDTSIIDKFLVGQATQKDVLTFIKNQLKSMTTPNIKTTIEKLREDGVKSNIFKRASVQKAQLNSLARKETRLTTRLNLLQNWSATITRWNATEARWGFMAAQWNITDMRWNTTNVRWNTTDLRWNNTIMRWNTTVARLTAIVERWNITSPRKANTSLWNPGVRLGIANRLENQLKLINHRETNVLNKMEQKQNKQARRDTQ